MTAQLQLFMILGAVVLLLIIFALLKRGLMSVKYSLLWLALAVGLVIAAAFPYVAATFPSQDPSSESLQ